MSGNQYSIKWNCNAYGKCAFVSAMHKSEDFVRTAPVTSSCLLLHQPPLNPLLQLTQSLLALEVILFSNIKMAHQQRKGTRPYVYGEEEPMPMESPVSTPRDEQMDWSHSPVQTPKKGSPVQTPKKGSPKRSPKKGSPRKSPKEDVQDGGAKPDRPTFLPFTKKQHKRPTKPDYYLPSSTGF